MAYQTAPFLMTLSDPWRH